MGLRIFSLCLSMVAIIVVSATSDANSTEQEKSGDLFRSNPDPNPCTNCKQIDSFLEAGGDRIDSLIGKAKAILEQSEPCDSQSSQVKVIIAESEFFAEATTIAFCPDDYPQMANCRCSNEDKSCQGVTVTDEETNRRGCIAHNGHDGYSVHAIAMCVEDEKFKVGLTTAADSTPTAECDDGGFLIDCWIKNAHVKDGLIGTVISDDRTSCKPSKACAEDGCQLTPLCYEA